MKTILFYAGILAAREITNLLEAKPLLATLCELHDGKPETICSEDVSLLLQQFDENWPNADGACLVHHGEITFKDGTKCPAILARVKTADSYTFIFGIPYRIPNESAGFAVHGPMAMTSEPSTDLVEDWADCLFEGFESGNPTLWEQYGEGL